MTKGKAFFVVGHENWGKSSTLREFSDGNNNQHYVDFGEHCLFKRQMSNDDKPSSYEEFAITVSPNDKPLLILTLCPNFIESSRRTEPILQNLAEKYDLFFWVMRHSYDGRRQVQNEQIDRLVAFGLAEIFDQQRESGERAIEFRRFVEARL